MYWQDHFKNPAHAIATLKSAARGKIRLTPQMAHIAHIAARSGLSGISEDPANLGTVPYRLTEDSDFLGGKRGLGFGYDGDGLRGLPELDFARMGQLDFARMGGLKSDIKSALKSSNAAKIQSALNREQAKIAKSPDSKKVAKRIAYVQSLQTQLAKVGTPTTPVLPGAPEQPIPLLAAPVATDPASFAQNSSGGSSAGFTPTPAPADATAAVDDTGMSLPMMAGIAAAGLAVLYLFMKKR